MSHHCPLQALLVLYTHLMTVLYGACPPSTVVRLSSVSFLRGEETFADRHFQTQISSCDAQPSDPDPGPSAIASLCVFGDKRRQQVSVRRLGAAGRELEEFVDGRRSKEEVVTKSNQTGGEPVQSHGLGETTHWCQRHQHISK